MHLPGSTEEMLMVWFFLRYPMPSDILKAIKNARKLSVELLFQVSGIGDG